MKQKVLIIFGGESVEHDISVITAVQAAKNLPDQFDFVLVYMDKKGIWWTADNLGDIAIYSNFQKLAKNKKQVTFVLGQNVLLCKKKNKFVPLCAVDCILNCCHGRIGEDGSVAGVARVCDIAHTASDVLSSAICMDKVAMKMILDGCGIKSAPWTYFEKPFDEKNVKNVKFPCIVKPSNLGSSIGISVCKNKEEFLKAMELAFLFDDRVLVENLVQNLQEYNCACFSLDEDLCVSNVQHVTGKGEIFSFEDKYLSSGRSLSLADKTLSAKIKQLTKKIYQIFDCQGVVRVDFLLDEKSGELYVNEINSIPGSMAFYLFADFGMKQVLFAIITEALQKKDEERKRIVTFKSDAISIFEKAQSCVKK